MKSGEKARALVWRETGRKSSLLLKVGESRGGKSAILSYCDLHLIGWSLFTLGRAVCFTVYNLNISDLKTTHQILTNIWNQYLEPISVPQSNWYIKLVPMFWVWVCVDFSWQKKRICVSTPFSVFFLLSSQPLFQIESQPNFEEYRFQEMPNY